MIPRQSGVPSFINSCQILACARALPQDGQPTSHQGFANVLCAAGDPRTAGLVSSEMQSTAPFCRRKHVYAFRVPPNAGTRYSYTRRGPGQARPIAKIVRGVAPEDIAQRTAPNACYQCGQMPIWCACMVAPTPATCSTATLGLASSGAGKACFDYSLVPVAPLAETATDNSTRSPRSPGSARSKHDVDESPRFFPSLVSDGSWVGRAGEVTLHKVAKAA